MMLDFFSSKQSSPTIALLLSVVAMTRTLDMCFRKYAVEGLFRLPSLLHENLLNYLAMPVYSLFLSLSWRASKHSLHKRLTDASENKAEASL